MSNAYRVVEERILKVVEDNGEPGYFWRDGKRMLRNSFGKEKLAIDQSVRTGAQQEAREKSLPKFEAGDIVTWPSILGDKRLLVVPGDGYLAGLLDMEYAPSAHAIGLTDGVNTWTITRLTELVKVGQL